MAQGAVAPMAVNGNHDHLTNAELDEILEYEKIVAFKDAVLAGTHPRIKVPAHVLAKLTNSTQHLPSPINSIPNSNHVAKSSQYHANQSQDQSSYFSTGNRNAPSANGQALKAGKSEIDPIFLQKSDDLIKAEMMLQRQRLERSLRDQIEDQRQKAKALLQTSESLPSFDISEVLLKAQALVNPSPPNHTEPVMATSDTQADVSDSFDENTFYSSQHDSSQWSNSSPGQKEPVETRSQGLAPVDRRSCDPQSANDRDEVVQRDINSLSTDNQLAAITQPPRAQYNSSNLPGLGMGNTGAKTSTSNVGKSAEVGAQQSNSFGKVATSKERPPSDQAVVSNTTNQLIQQAFDNGPASPIMRVHNLSPLAPQPARVSPLVTARDPPTPRGDLHANEGQPAQVTALRNQTGGMSSTDSSPKANKQPEREKKQRGKGRKKRKANNSGDSPDSVYIKPEPRSTSPYAVAPLPRPQKRQRQVGQYAAELNYDDNPRYQPEGAHDDRMFQQERFTEPRTPLVRERAEEPYEPEFRRPEPAARRVVREDESYRRVSSDSFARRPLSPASPAYADYPRVARAASPADDERATERPRYYYKEPIRVLRSDADRERSRSPVMREPRSPIMAPSRQPVRIVVDEYGREYIDPTPAPASMRQSVAPSPRYREEVVYERPLVRAAPRRAAIEYEEDGIVYRRPPSPISAIPRRIVTQPEFAMPPPADYRSYREREYSARPATMAPPGDDYTPTRATDRRVVSQYDAPAREYATRTPAVREREPYSRAVSVHPDAVRYEARGDIPRELTRAPSVRPGPEMIRYHPREEAPREYVRAPTSRPEPIRYETREEALRDYDTRAMSVRPDVRYEVPREYVSRLSSVRPEAGLREYSGNIPPEARREMVPMPQREYSVRPMEAPARREFIPPPREERYYEDAPRGRPVEVRYADAPRVREPSVVVYAEEPRREMYR
jgi:hypothetical protein